MCASYMQSLDHSMNPASKQIEELLADESFIKYCNGDEKEKLYWEKQFQQNPALFKQARQLYELLKAEFADIPAEKERFEAFIQEHISANGGPDENQSPVVEMPVRRKRRIWAAASIIAVMLAAGGYYLLLNKAPDEVVTTTQKETLLNNDATPGGNRAVLTLADGSQIILDSAANGTLSEQGNIKVLKLNNGRLSYNKTANPSSEVLYNKVSTPRGGQYNIILSDGTAVWLNAVSSIRYPAAFTGNERKVEITGEAYFEVAPLTPKGESKKMPFIVQIVTPSGESGKVEVLGTHFNINAYGDEPVVKTTLLEGSVKVTKDIASAILRPGEQVSISQSSGISHPIPVQTDEVIAWKNGLFHFNNTSLNELLRQLVRWYDVEVEFQGQPVEQRFGGEITRDNNLSDVLQILNYSRIKFSIEGKKIIVRS